MAYNDFVTNIMNADTDALAFQRFMQGAPSEIVKRRIAGDTKTLDYFLAFLRGLELVYSQQNGEVDVNGVKVKTVTQAVRDAISAAGVANGVNANLVADTALNLTQAQINSNQQNYNTHQYVANDGTVEGGVNAKPATSYSTISPDLHMCYIAFGGHKNYPHKIGTFAGSGAHYSTISGGYDNQIDCIAGTISGGAHHRLYGNLANTTHNTIGGGSYNDVERGEYVTISGGTQNKVKSTRRDGTTSVVATNSVIGGGNDNKVYGGNVTIAGGLNNSADGDSASVGGGQANKADGNFTVVAGGGNNEARLGKLGGGQKNTISGGRYNTIDSATNPGGNTISGGENHNVYGSYNTVAGGINCDVGVSGTEPSHSTINGGMDNAITGTINAATISGGRSNTVTASYAAVTHGQGNSATATHSRAGGQDAVCRIVGGDSIASGKFAVAGDAQSTVFINKGVTTDANATQIGNTTVLPDNTTQFVTALVVARRADAQNESAAYKAEFIIDRQTGVNTVALVAPATVTVIAEDDASLNIEIKVNLSNGGWHLSATGAAGKTIRWVVRNTVIEVSS